MTQTKKVSPIIKLGAWLLSFIVFLIGFYHSHLGLKGMRPFDLEYGSFIVAGSFLLFILISYSMAVSGRKYALLFYILGGCAFFIFNLNYFYPTDLGRQLIKEEAIALNDTLQSFSNKISRMDNSNSISTVSELYNLKEKLMDEVRGQDGFGPRATKYLNEFNELSNGTQLPNRVVGKTDEERKLIAARFDTLLTKDIRNYVVKQIANGKVENADELLNGIEQLKLTNEEYTPKLKKIIADDSRIKLDSITNHPQTTILQNLVTSIDNATIKINKSSGKELFPKIGEAKTRKLGRIEHTIASALERINRIDTWKNIFICLFIDLLFPLFIYVMIRKKDDEEDDFFIDRLFGKNKNFNK